MKSKQITITALIFALAITGPGLFSQLGANFANPLGGAFAAIPSAQAYNYSQQIAQLDQEIAQYEEQLRQLGADKKTLQAAISSLDLRRNQIEAQIELTQTQINQTQSQIQQLGAQIDAANQQIYKDKADLAQYIREIQKSDNNPAIMQMLASGSFSDFWQSVDQTSAALNAVKEKVRQLQIYQLNLSGEKDAVQQKSDSLASQQETLSSQKETLSVTMKSKNDLLNATNSQESKYQRLLAQAKAQLESFSNFSRNAGGASLLPNETVCDNWGCYYNQRDAAWGANALNGTQYNLASDGCLITDVAMVMTHYGHRNVTPETINSNPDNFASYYPAYLLYTVTADGITATRVRTAIDSTLASGNPVIIGMRVYGGTHFVVLISGANGNYVMQDPYLAAGHDASFAAHYNLGEVYSITRVVVSE